MINVSEKFISLLLISLIGLFTSVSVNATDEAIHIHNLVIAEMFSVLNVNIETIRHNDFNVSGEIPSTAENTSLSNRMLVNLDKNSITKDIAVPQKRF